MQSIATAIGIRKICACRWMPSAFPDRSFAEPFGARTLAGAGYASMDYCACQITQYGSLVEPMSVPR